MENLGLKDESRLRSNVQHDEKRRRGGNKKLVVENEDEDHYSNIERFLHGGHPDKNSSLVDFDEKKGVIKNGIGQTTKTEPTPDFDFHIGSWLESLLFNDYNDYLSHSKEDNTHTERPEDSHIHFADDKKGHHQHSHSDLHSHEVTLAPNSYSATSVSMATWLVSFSSIMVISVVRVTWGELFFEVGVMPLLQGQHREALLSLLVALAVSGQLDLVNLFF